MARQDRPVVKSSSYTTPDAHLFTKVANKAAGGMILTSRWERDKRWQATIVLFGFAWQLSWMIIDGGSKARRQ